MTMAGADIWQRLEQGRREAACQVLAAFCQPGRPFFTLHVALPMPTSHCVGMGFVQQRKDHHEEG